MKKVARAAAVLGSASFVTAQSSLARTCPETNLCYSLNIPESTVGNNGQGDIYFQMSAPTSYQWVALGQGSSMSGSNIFVMYTSSNGENVTVSPRLGTGHVEPQHDTNAQIEVLEGSGVSDGMMVANVKCSNCNEWQGGSMDFTAQSANWIYASRTGDSLDSDDVTEDIQQHNRYSPFQWQLSEAQGGDNVNPFVAAAAATTGLDSQTASATNSQQNASPTASDRLTTAHGSLASVAFVALFPTGALLIRLASFTGLVWLHAAIQAVAYLVFVAAFGLGVYIATQLNEIGTYHPIIGIVLFVVLFTQPVTGLMHHRLFKSRGGRTIFSFVHLGIGRAAIILGIINGGLGLLLAGAASSVKIAYAVCAAVVGVTYIASAVFGEVKRTRSPTYPEAQLAQAKGHRQLDSVDEQNPGIGMADLQKQR
ncbi:hypothetical protein CERZMDRAFT_113053 [Cercospora zeae-maydis SCOH1-5]|uniref:Cytochrome b561 domain-containing protein n=1 Tax=Cercospora zeae-maydis SCOH1-5 TaxID=717836 RepID=A0A6A6FBW7_9PEZI|nr:hypothetical protein CERZMDRAFT_113053 [Cercospora zeae-maydis SCOH1-5]